MCLQNGECGSKQITWNWCELICPQNGFAVLRNGEDHPVMTSPLCYDTVATLCCRGRLRWVACCFIHGGALYLRRVFVVFLSSQRRFYVLSCVSYMLVFLAVFRYVLLPLRCSRRRCLPFCSERAVVTGWFRLNAQNCVPGNSSRRFFELDHEILHTYSGRQYLKLEEGGFFIWGFAVEISGF